MLHYYFIERQPDKKQLNPDKKKIEIVLRKKAKDHVHKNWDTIKFSVGGTPQEEILGSVIRNSYAKYLKEKRYLG